MRSRRPNQPLTIGLALVCLAPIAAFLAGCELMGGGLAALPFARITAVQLFEQPEYTVAFSVEGAVTKPALVDKINWVFGDGSGFVEGPAGRATATHVYAATGTYEVVAYVFDAGGLVAQINGSAHVVESGAPGPDPTAEDLPAAIDERYPVDGAGNVSVDVALTWTAADRASSYDVYLGTTEDDVAAADVNSEEYLATITTLSHAPGGLDPSTTYYWRIDGRNNYGVTQGAVLSFTTAAAPTLAANFVPADSENNVPVETLLYWTAAPSVTGFDVYFGIDPDAVEHAGHGSLEYKGYQTSKSFNPPGMLGDTLYYWRIDTRGPGGTSTGAVLSFRTALPPPQVTTPVVPADNAANAAYNTNLEWNISAGAGTVTGYDVYLSTNESDVVNGRTNAFKGRYPAMPRVYDPADFLPDTQYFWRIDAVGPGGITQGLVLKFRVAALPQVVQNPPTPASGAHGVALDAVLAWIAGSGAASHDVYLGTDADAVSSATIASAEFKGNQAAATFDPFGADDLEGNTTYYWRIDEVSPGGKTVGPVWNFMTVPARAIDPTPEDEDVGIDVNTELTWTAGDGAASHDIYLGTVEADVQNATTATPGIYKGNRTSATYEPDTLAPNTVYYWRVDEVGGPGNGKTPGEVWQFTTGAGQATDPDPADGEAAVAVTGAVLAWTAGAGATSHDVYFGTSSTAVDEASRTSPQFKGNQAGTSYNLGILTGATSYFWRIDSVTADGTTKGEIWSFQTGPGKAASPNPADFAIDVELDAFLLWTAGSGAVTHDVYLGTNLTAVTNATTADAEYQGNQGGTTFDPGGLTGHTWYYWRVDEVAADTSVVTKGDVWRFRSLRPPEQVGSPSPANGATGQSVTVSLSWAAANRATSYDVYFSATEADVASGDPAAYQGNQGSGNRTFAPGTLAHNTMYYWRIDAVNDAGTTQGLVWRFTTVP